MNFKRKSTELKKFSFEKKKHFYILFYDIHYFTIILNMQIKNQILDLLVMQARL